MDHPFDNYLKAQVLLRRGPAEVAEEMGKYSLFASGNFEVHYDYIRASVSQASPSIGAYVAGEVARRPRSNVLQRAVLDIRLVTDPDCDVVREAYRLIDFSRVRHTTEVMLLLAEPVSTVVGDINEKYGFGMTAEGLECFQFYFWNTARMTRSDFGVWLNNVPDEHLPLHRQALTYEPGVVLARAGVGGRRKPFKDVLEDVVTQAYDAFTNIMRLPGSEYSGDAMQWLRYMAPLLKDTVKFTDEDEARKLIEEVALELVERNTAGGLRDSSELVTENDELDCGESASTGQ